MDNQTEKAILTEKEIDEMLGFTEDNNEAMFEEYDGVPKGIINLVENASNEGYAPIMYREQVIKSIYRNLLSMTNSNTILIGDTGVGKTSVIYEIARQISTESALTTQLFSDIELYEINLIEVMTQTEYRGKLEERLMTILKFASERPQALFFIDDIHLLFAESGADNEYSKVAEYLKPALSQNKINVIGATTTQEYKSIENNPAFKRRFNTIVVTELSNEQTFHLLKEKTNEAVVSTKKRLDKSLAIDDSLLDFIIYTANTHMVGTRRPANALKLLDLTISQAVIDEVMKNPYTENHEITVTANSVETTLKAIYQYDVQLSSESVERLKKELKKRIISQTTAINKIVNVMERESLGLTERKRPISLMMTGASGTGKTETAKIIAETLFKDVSTNFINLNMTQYAEESSIAQLIGASMGLVSSNSNKELPLDPLITNPHQVVLLDEFEKAHPTVQKLFMQALDEGYITTKRNQRIDFSKAIVIATTNAGVDNRKKTSIGFNGTDNQSNDEVLTKALSQHFPVELLNRFEHVVGYQSISKDDYKRIIIHHYKTLVSEINRYAKYTIIPTEITLTNVPTFIEIITNESYNPMLNARPAQRAVKAFLEQSILKSRNSREINLNALETQ